MTRIGKILASRDERRRVTATERAAAALAALRDARLDAWVIGSLARGTFRQHSDIDLLVDAPPGRMSEAINLCLQALHGFPSSIVFKADVPPDILPSLLDGALDESGLRG